MTAQEPTPATAGEWVAGEGEDTAAGLDADYSFVVRRWTRLPEKRPWGDVDYGESEPVAIAQSAEFRDQIVADHNAASRLRIAEEALRAVEYVELGWRDPGPIACPLCIAFKDDGEPHQPDCLIGNALKGSSHE